MTVSISETDKEKQKDVKVEDVIWAYRHNRNLLLDETDKYMTTDYPITEDKKKDMVCDTQSCSRSFSHL